MPDLTRRSVVRVGVGAVWAAPVVTLASAAPALASSPNSTIGITGFTAAYVADTGDIQGTIEPSRLRVTATLTCGGPQDASGLQLTLSVPAEVSDEPPAGGSAVGFSGPSVESDGNGGWTVVYTAAEPLGNGNQITLVTELGLGSTTMPPFLGHRGASFVLYGSATAGNADAYGEYADVTEGPRPILSPMMTLASTITTVDDADHLELDATNVRVGEAESRCGIGRLTLDLFIPKGPEGNPLHEMAPTGADSPVEGWSWVSGPEDVTWAWLVTYQTVNEGFSGWADPVVAHRGPGTFRASLGLPAGAGEITPVWRFRAEGLQSAGGT